MFRNEEDQDDGDQATMLFHGIRLLKPVEHTQQVKLQRLHRFCTIFLLAKLSYFPNQQKQKKGRNPYGLLYITFISGSSVQYMCTQM